MSSTGFTEANKGESEWKKLRMVAIEKGTKLDHAIVELSSIAGRYNEIWDELSSLEDTADHGKEETWLSIVEEGENKIVSGKIRWRQKAGKFQGMIRDEDAQDNIWLLQNVEWRTLEHLGDQKESVGDDEPEIEEHPKDGHGLAVLATLDGKGHPFLETIFRSKMDPEEYRRIIWKRNSESSTDYANPLTEGEAKQLLKDGVLEKLEIWGSWEKLKDDDEEKLGDDDAEGDDDEDYKNEKVASLRVLEQSASQYQNSGNTATGSKRSAESIDSDNDGSGKEREKKKVKMS